jgi:O-antigen ligase
MLIFTIPFDSYGILDAASFSISLGDLILLFIIFIIAINLAFFDTKFTVPRTGQIDFFMLVSILVWGGLSAYLNDSNAINAVLYMKAIFKLSFIYMITVIFLNNPSKLQWGAKAILLSALGTSILATVQALGVVPLEIGRPLRSRLSELIAMNILRSAGPYVIYGHYGMWLLLGFFLALSMTLPSKGLARRSALMLVVLSLLIGIVVSQTRSIWLAAFLSICGFFLTYSSKPQPRMIPGNPVVRVTLLLTLIFSLFTLSIIQSLITSSVNLQPGTLYERLRIAHVGITLFTQHPILGIGYGRFLELAEGAGVIKVPHNIFLELLLSTGILGITLFLIFLGIIFIRISRTIKMTSDLGNQTLARGLLWAFFAIMVIAQFVRGLYSAELWVSMGLISAFYFTIRKESASKGTSRSYGDESL